MIHCFFHKVDWDGVASAAIVTKNYPNLVNIHPYNYNMEFPFNDLGKDDLVYFVDVSIQPYTELIRLCDIVKKVVVIDHHKSLIDFFKNKNDLPENLELFLDDKFASCELTWKYFFPNKPKPKTIHLLGQYDSWRNKPSFIDYDWDTVLAFQYGMRLLELNPTNVIDKLDDYYDEDCLIKIIERGKTILEYQKEQNKVAMKNSFKSQLMGLNCLCLNTNLANSQVFESKWDEDIYDVMIAFNFNGESYKYSAYTTKDNVDCSKLAKEFGGGGHQKAAGFFTEILLF